MPDTAFGFASMNGGTTGGYGGSSITVSNGVQLQTAINSITGTSKPLTIYVDGMITLANSGVQEIVIDGRNNLSIIGTGAGAEFAGIGIHVKNGSSNLIIQNLKIHDVASGTKDAIGIEGPSKNIWIDNNELYSSLAVAKDYYDGLLDIKRGAEYITVSDNYFHDHHKSSLVGYSDTDVGARYVTYAYNVFEDIGSRTPSVRFGYAHVYNNLYEDVSTSAINLRMGAVGLIENNVFKNVKNPIVSLDSADIGFWELNGNLMSNVTWSAPGAGEANAESGRSTGSYDAPYAYTLTSAQQTEAYVRSNAGVGHLGNSPPPPDTLPPPTGPVPTNPTPPTSPPTSDVTVKGTENGDVLTGSSGNDVIDGAGGEDRISGADGDDRLSGGSDNDTLSGGNGNDIVLGGEGRDSLFGDAGHDRLDGGASADRLDGGGGMDTLAGGTGNDVLTGGDNDDAIDGGAGKDVLLGGAGNDVLAGGADSDKVEGGAGKDILSGGDRLDSFVFRSAADTPMGTGRDVIVDFLGDRVDLSLIDAKASEAEDQAFTFVGEQSFSGAQGELNFVRDASVTLVQGDVDGDRTADFQIEFAKVMVFTANDFLL
jgi:pectate lyase